MTKRELVIQVAAKLGMTQNEVADIVQTMLDTVTETLVDGNRLEIRNFGVFEVKERDSRVGRNPRTGVEVPIPQKRVASFKPGKVLKDWVQSDSGQPRPLFKGDENDIISGNGSALPASADLSAGSKAPDAGVDQQSLF